MSLAKPAAIIFDWDNTLVDSWGTIHAALESMFRAMGYPPWSLAETRAKVRQSLRDTFPALFGERWEEAQRLYLSAFEAVHLSQLAPLADAQSMIETCSAQGIYLAIVSNKTGHYLRREVEALGWGSHFRQIIGAGDAQRDKPDPAPVLLALAGSGIAPGPQVWFVGDTGIDVACAINAGCTPVLLHGQEGDDLSDGEAIADRSVRRFADCAALAREISHERTCNSPSSDTI